MHNCAVITLDIYLLDSYLPEHFIKYWLVHGQNTHRKFETTGKREELREKKSENKILI